ncbi:MAG: ribbon-helix-helix domain-containing protein [Acutalibacteraceae bacterium]|nr:ribbon-helix-helix domain-containing protein [Acutalibacteraceae bacterium]
MDNDSKRIGLYINQDLLKACDNAIPRTNATSRSDFISNAIEFYIAWLDSKNTTKILTPALESVIGSKILDTEDRIARVLFKQGVELAMLMHVVAATNDITESQLKELRKICVEEVKRNGGKYKFEDAFRFQKG